MPQQRTKYDVALDFILYSVLAYYNNHDKDWTLIKKTRVSLLLGLIGTLIRMILQPYVDGWKARLKKKRADKRNVMNAE